MKTVWTVCTYVSSELPLTEKVVNVMSITFVIRAEEPPSEEAILALVNLHIRNCEPLMSEVSRNEVPDGLF